MQQIMGRFILRIYRRKSSVSKMLKKFCNLLQSIYNLKYNDATGLDSRKYFSATPHRTLSLNNGETVRPFLAKYTTFKYFFFVRAIEEGNSLSSLRVDRRRVSVMYTLSYLYGTCRLQYC